MKFNTDGLAASTEYDIAGWADASEGVELLDRREGDGVYRHYVRRE